MRRTTALLMVPVLLSACSGGGSKGSVTATGPAGAQVATIGMNDSDEFVPGEVQAKVGTLTLTVENLGGKPHNLVFTDESLGRTTTMGRDDTTPLKLLIKKAGTYTFECTYHSGMDGRVIVS